ncbi:hypothetical protein CAMSH0001_1450 [Campylobacter showae RM3277]|uniref:Uncharacterized protein n=1 Tax=Campylobacter showae RM3277 TaxID=553219 RepID=C6RIV3_9BACT|nr:hypothetical protein CAMSH0001_1450 [Campylobacter showae RM3277]
MAGSARFGGINLSFLNSLNFAVLIYRLIVQIHEAFLPSFFKFSAFKLALSKRALLCKFYPPPPQKKAFEDSKFSLKFKPT